MVAAVRDAGMTPRGRPDRCCGGLVEAAISNRAAPDEIEAEWSGEATAHGVVVRRPVED